MVTVFDVEPYRLIKKTAEELKGIDEIKPPIWIIYTKSGRHKERPPFGNDFWYIRTASILRKVYVMGPIGVSKLRTKFGGLKGRGYKPEHTYKGSGSIVRKSLQQLEKAGLIQQTIRKGHKGRIITSKGRKFLDNIAKNAR
ncbi:30S ribosomal protein S19e [Candidatus Woesearchaeota archaeon]|nr:30S ribosomal protein S19e [Candidatus Woesearchaeota archaeon]